MPKLDENLLNKLENGEFKNINLDYWFKRGQWEYIFAVIYGLDKNLNKELLDQIITYAELLLLDPNVVSKYNQSSHKNSDDVTFNCEMILTEAIRIGSGHHCYTEILEPLCKSTNDTVRLYCCANLDLKDNWWEQDVSRRVVKVGYLRQEFAKCWNNVFDDDQKSRIEYFANACSKFGAIKCFFSNHDVEYTTTVISSLLFKTEDFCCEFDIDVLSTIKDKRILGYCLNKLYEDGYLEFRSNVRLPECFKARSDKEIVKARKLVDIKYLNSRCRVKQ